MFVGGFSWSLWIGFQPADPTACIFAPVKAGAAAAYTGPAAGMLEASTEEE